jgi:arginyl-tRNA synthetase
MIFFEKEKDEISNLLIGFYINLSKDHIQIQQTRKEFEGDYTIVIFSLLNFSKKPLLETGNEIGAHLVNKIHFIKSYNVVNGFLNLVFEDIFWFSMFQKDCLGKFKKENTNQRILVEFSSPNTNKPLHLGHMRNILLGYSIANILEQDGNDVKRVQIINDRGIHICKSMLAWLKFGNNDTPKSAQLKGDHFVGKYYIKFDQEYQIQQKELIKQGYDVKYAKLNAPLMKEAQDMLIAWENGDSKIIDLWQMMNKWVYDGFEKTYSNLGVFFDKNYYESDTYLIGKKYVNEGVDNGLLIRESDSSVWVDLTEDNLDKKILLRADGTTVYMTQDIGTAILRQEDFDFDQMIYVVGNEQNYHFDVLFKVLNKIGFKWASELYHLSYGMVDLPSGKMKSREGTVVDIDDLLQSMYNKAKDIITKTDKNIETKDIDSLSILVGDAALKYFILKTDAKKNILFNPEESIDFNGHTGPFIQYTFVRINSILHKLDSFPRTYTLERSLLTEEKMLIYAILSYKDIISQSALSLNPALLANYIYNLAKDYNHFYQKIPILNVDDINDVYFRVTLSEKVGSLISEGMNLLGIKVPLKM